jgi:hypothetical protein
VPDGARSLPPLPRQHSAPARKTERRPLRSKRLQAEAARELRARRLSELAAWLAAEVLGGRREVRLSEAELGAPDAPRRWLDVARARHLDFGRDLGRLGVGIEAREGKARLGGGAFGLEAPDCLVRAADGGRGRGGKP